jgi:hypothetical protein
VASRLLLKLDWPVTQVLSIFMHCYHFRSQIWRLRGSSAMPELSSGPSCGR